MAVSNECTFVSAFILSICSFWGIVGGAAEADDEDEEDDDDAALLLLLLNDAGEAYGAQLGTTVGGPSAHFAVQAGSSACNK